MPLNPRRAVCGLLIAAGTLAAGSAIAAEPESGKVDAANPRVDWKGEVTASWQVSRAVIVADAAGQSGMVPCQAPTCDSFALTVGEKKDLTVGVTAPDPEDQIVLRILTPGGDYVTTVGNADAKGQLLVKIKGAATGEYTVDYWNYYYDGPIPYAGFAQLGAPATAGTPTTSGAEPPDNQQSQTPQSSNGRNPAQQTGQQPRPSQPAESIALKVKVAKASAKKLKKARKLNVKVNVSRPASVSAFLRKGKKTIGKGKLAKVDRAGTLKLKLSKKAARRLKKGKYLLDVVATDGKTSTSKRVKVTVRR